MQMKKIAFKTLPRKLKQLGLTTVEYAVAGGLIVAGIVATFSLLGGKVKTIVDAITTAL